MKPVLLAAAAFLAAVPAMAQDEAATGGPNAQAADDLPRGAPRDDYEFVAWCAGVLTTHMSLYPKVKTELEAIAERWDTVEEDAETYALQRKAGEEAKVLFERALRAAEMASPRNIEPQGRAAYESGVRMWQAIDTVDPRNQAYSWMGWELPPRCERVAADLEAKSTLNAALLRDTSGATAVEAPPAPAANTAPAGERLR